MQIEHGIPIPNGPLYPFDDMEVGDSFALPVDQANNVRTAVTRYKKESPDWGYTTRIMDNVIRLWRTK